MTDERRIAMLEEKARDIPTLLGRIRSLTDALDKAQRAYHFSVPHDRETDPAKRYTCQSGICAELIAVLTVQRSEAEAREDTSTTERGAQ